MLENIIFVAQTTPYSNARLDFIELSMFKSILKEGAHILTVFIIIHRHNNGF
jgi:hypothetical protein